MRTVACHEIIVWYHESQDRCCKLGHWLENMWGTATETKHPGVALEDGVERPNQTQFDLNLEPIRLFSLMNIVPPAVPRLCLVSSSLSWDKIVPGHTLAVL